MKKDTGSLAIPDQAPPIEPNEGTSPRRRGSDARGITNVGRRAVERRAYAVRHDNSILDLRVLDLSYDGCAVETIERLVPGELLNLSMLGRGFVRATVRWYKDRRAGLLFDPDQLPNTCRERAAERLPIAAQMSLRRSGRLGYPVRTSDLSVLGCKCEFVERPSIGERVWVKFAGLQAIAADVCWLADSNVGLQFRNPIHPAVFEVLLHRLRHDAAKMSLLEQP
jgi:hypothetical protein